MIRGADEQPFLFATIDRWRQEVVKDTLQQASTQSRSHKYEAHHMKLRSFTRTALAEVSGNPYSRKRKAFGTMADAPPRKEQSAQRGRGRPRKSREVDINEEEHVEQSASRPQGRLANIAESADPYESSLPSYHNFPPPETPRRGSSSPSKSNGSPSKRGQPTLDKIVSEAAIDMKYLGRCDPAVHLTNFRLLKQAQERIPSLVGDLYEKLRDVPLGLIPGALEREYGQDADTPRKSKEQHSRSHFLPRQETPFPVDCLSRMKSTVDKVLEKAEEAHSQGAHERQWGALVNQLLCEVEIWQKGPEQVVVLNVESCDIQPVEMRPKKPSPHETIPIDCATQIATSDSKTKTPSDNVGRMVDWCLALKVDWNSMKVIQRAFSRILDYESSLNQTFSYIRNHPLILDIEIKKVSQPRDPQVQLAIWASSALLKKRHMGWNTSLPMPAVAVNGHWWDYYISFEMDKKLMVAGPYEFGTTATLNGIWTIFYRLHIIMEWGMTTYKEWFRANIVAWAQRLVDEAAD